MENLVSKNLAPIVLFVYARPDHTKKTLDALANNLLAKESELHVFVDGPKNERAKVGNDAVKELIKEEALNNRFASVTSYISEKNKGLATSIISGVTEIMNRFGRCIVIEDDVITSTYFLTYMNDALNFYEENKKIYSIAGFTYPLKALEKYSHDVYMSYRSCSMCWASWKDRWELVDWQVSDYDQLKKSYKLRKKFNRGGNDLFRMLRHQMRGERDSWAIRYCYAQSKHDLYAVYPRFSLAQNIGNDGSGTHCSDLGDKANQPQLIEQTNIKFENLQIDKKVARDFKNQYRVTFGEAIKWVIRKVFKRK